MGNYPSQISDQNFDQRIAEIRQRVTGISPSARSVIEAQDRGVLERIELLLDRVLLVLQTTDAETAPTNRPSELSSTLGELSGVLANFAANPHETYVPHLTRLAEILANQLWTWPTPPLNSLTESVTEAAARFRRSAGQHLASLASETELVNEAVTQLRQRVNESDADLDSRLTSMEAQTTATQAAANQTIERLEAAQARNAEQFSAAQERRGNEFGKAMEELRADAELAAGARTAESKAVLEEIENRLEQAKRLVSVFAGAGSGYAYGKEAKDQAVIADKWRLAAIIIALCAIIPGVLIFFVVADTTSGRLYEAIAKGAVGLAIVGAAGYAARQSSLHRHREQTSRRIELQLVTLAPFTEGLEQEDRDDMRKELVRTVFAPPPTDSSLTVDASQVITKDQVSLIQTLLAAVLKR